VVGVWHQQRLEKYKEVYTRAISVVKSVSDIFSCPLKIKDITVSKASLAILPRYKCTLQHTAPIWLAARRRSNNAAAGASSYVSHPEAEN